MFIKKSEFEAIASVLFNQSGDFVPQGAEFENLPKEQQEAIVKADTAIVNILKRHKAQNRKTADYIANKRKQNKNYAR